MVSSAKKCELQRRLERASAPPRISTEFPGVNTEGFLDTESSRLLPSPRNVPTPNARRHKLRRVDRIFDGSEQTDKNSRKPRRRASIEKQIKQDPYHTFLEGGQLFSDDEVIEDLDTDKQEPVQPETSEEESPNTQQLQLIRPAPDAAVETARPPLISVLCGRQDPKSRYLTRRLVRMPRSNEPEPETLFKHRDIDPDAAELYRLWEHTGIIPTRYRDINFDRKDINPEHTWVACWPLINAAIHGFMIQDVEFVDRVMDLLEEKIAKGTRPDVDTISHVFGENRHHMPRALQHFLVDRWIHNSSEGFESIDALALPEVFVHFALDSAMRRLSHGTQTSPLSACQYHSHSKSERCYKDWILPTVAERQERYKYRREKASQEAEQVPRDSIEYGIAVVDWEQRRAEAHRALREQVDDHLRAANSRPRTSGQQLEGKRVQRHELSDDAQIPEREKGSERQLGFRSAALSMFGTAQAEGPVDEVKFAPPAREPPPPSPSSEPVEHHDGSIESDPCLKEAPGDQEVAMTSYCGAIPGVKGEESFESTLQDAPSLPPALDACARTVSQENSHQKERTSCPRAFPESRSGSRKSMVSSQKGPSNVL